MDTAYMTEAYLEQYKFAIDKAREYGMECWLYDEGGDNGGTVIAEGTPEEVSTIEASHTGRYLKRILDK